jgi:hypothetical protein
MREESTVGFPTWIRAWGRASMAIVSRFWFRYLLARPMLVMIALLVMPSAARAAAESALTVQIITPTVGQSLYFADPAGPGAALSAVIAGDSASMTWCAGFSPSPTPRSDCVLPVRYSDDEPGSPWTWILYLDTRATSERRWKRSSLVALAATPRPTSHGHGRESELKPGGGNPL